MYDIDDISNLIDTLQGTTLEFSQACEMNGIPYEELTDNDIENIMETVNEALFLCPNCGWWEELCELGEEYCKECEERIKNKNKFGFDRRS